jgi:hypothetical protein
MDTVDSLLLQRDELIDLLIEALPYVEESEQFNKPTHRTLSKKIRDVYAKVYEYEVRKRGYR